MAEGYREVYAGWENDPVGFWMAAARDIDWVSPPTIGFDPESGAYGRWFPDAICNTCHNAIDRHVAAGRGNQTAKSTIPPSPRPNGGSATPKCWPPCRPPPRPSRIWASARATG